MQAPRIITILYAIAVAAGLVSLGFFIMQGGFGGGHGDWDAALWALSLPWGLIAWPGFVEQSDFFRLTLLPFFFNVLLVTIVRRLLVRSG